MARKATFDELLAKREQREADRMKIGLLAAPGGQWGLEARMPSQKTVLDLYGELVAASDARESLLCGSHAVYACCPQLWDKKLQEELGCQDEPMKVLDELFTPAELDQLGGQALRFLGLLPEVPAQGEEGEGEQAPGLEMVKN